MPEFPDRLCDDELARQPAATSYRLYYTAHEPTYFGLGVTNTAAADAHISVYLIGSGEVGWANGQPPPPYTAIVSRQRIEADTTDGNVWEMPTCVLRDGDRIAVFTDLVGVNFNGHGIRLVGAT